MFLTHITYKKFLDYFTLALFALELTQDFLDFLETSYQIPDSYSEKWTFKSFWDDYAILIKKQNLKTLTGDFETTEQIK